MASKKIISILFFLMLSFYGICEEGESKEEKKELSILEQWRETLLFGIADEIIEVLKSIKSAKETALNNELVKVLSTSVNTDLQKAILDYFTQLEYDGGESTAFTFLSEAEERELNTSFLISLINYLASIKSEKLKGQLTSLIEKEDNELSMTAIRAIGKIMDTSKVEYLLEKLDDSEFPDERKPSILLVLGDLKAIEAVDSLIEIVEDKYQEKIWRMYACDSLGKIGDDRAVPVLKKTFSENDALLRAYAAHALSAFDLSSVIDLLIQGLKDSNWNVRFHCAQALANKDAKKAIDILIYKAKKDPVKKVQLEALKALGKIGTKKCFDFIRETFSEKFESLDTKQLCLDLLVDNDLANSLDIIKKVMTEFMDAPAHEFKIVDLIAKKLSITESPLLQDIFKNFLQSDNMYIRIYGIRGAALNRFMGLKEKIRILSEKDPVAVVRREALSALTKMM
ncbi:MAG: HEAT repeat domain-containing protein [Spirochaetales bacterium]|nr:HEAT repeat domain-containing protein [Spirochaetales bacterium]